MNTKCPDLSSLFLKLSRGEALSREDSRRLIEMMMEGAEPSLSSAQIGAYLLGTAFREVLSSDEIIAGAEVLKEHMLPLEHGLSASVVDTCGTGGSGLDTFGTSTTAAFVVAGAGQAVAKHGNRSASSRTGSADLIEALGVRLDCGVEVLADCLNRSNFCFMFAPFHHSATRRVAGIRKELGIKTIFNYLGPLVNPARVKRQLLGVSSAKMQGVIAQVLLESGAQHAMVVRGDDGLDEVSITGESRVLEVSNGKLKEYKLSPQDFGFEKALPEDIKGAEANEMAALVRGLLGGEPSAYRNFVVINAACALYVGGKVKSLAEGRELAEHSIDSGAAAAVLEKVIEICA